MARYARIERERLADALLAVGPAAPTLCEGWDTRDLAAHLVVRERRADAAAGIAVKPLAAWTEQVRVRYRDHHSYPQLVDQVRSVPWWNPLVIPAIDEITNLLEYYVHHEDVLRAQPDWQPRTIEPELARGLWGRVPGLARIGLRSVPATVTVEAPEYGHVVVGRGERTVRLRGDPGELVLFFFGRQAAAQVEIDGPEDLAHMLSAAKFDI
jgi:uncharacterized protein (TIGR03085 family)